MANQCIWVQVQSRRATSLKFKTLDQVYSAIVRFYKATKTSTFSIRRHFSVKTSIDSYYMVCTKLMVQMVRCCSLLEKSAQAAGLAKSPSNIDGNGLPPTHAMV